MLSLFFICEALIWVKERKDNGLDGFCVSFLMISSRRISEGSVPTKVVQRRSSSILSLRTVFHLQNLNVVKQALY